MSWVSIPWDFGAMAAMLASAALGPGLRNRSSQELPAGLLLLPYELLRGCIAAAWLALGEGTPTGSWAAHALKPCQSTTRTNAPASGKCLGILLFQPAQTEAFQLQCLLQGVYGRAAILPALLLLLSRLAMELGSVGAGLSTAPSWGSWTVRSAY